MAHFHDRSWVCERRLSLTGDIANPRNAKWSSAIRNTSLESGVVAPLLRTCGRLCILILALGLAAAPCSLQARERGAERIALIAVSDLPAQARETLALIRQGGPFPHSRDGTVFGNREGLLPHAPRGSYREYTVSTPGRRDRGARRIIGSKGGEFYYTADHYRSFRRILQ